MSITEGSLLAMMLCSEMGPLAFSSLSLSSSDSTNKRFDLLGAVVLATVKGGARTDDKEEVLVAS